MEVFSAWKLLLDARTLVLGIVVFLVLFRYLRRPRNRPPGPWGLPILGNLQLLMPGDTLFRRISKLTDRYGKVMSIDMCGIPIVVLHGHDTVKEAFSRYELSNRPPPHITESIASGVGILASSGEQWTEIRRFSMTVLRGLGVGKSRFEENISTEAEILVEELKKFNSKAFDPRHLIGNAVSNIICSVVFGKRFQYTDPAFKRLLKVLNDLVLELQGGGMLENAPIFAKLKMLPFVRKYVIATENFFNYINILLKEHSKGQSSDLPQDFIDMFEDEQKVKERQGVKSLALLPENLKHIVGDLFGAGSETTATTLRWGMLYMIAHPEIQRRVQKELDDVTSRNRLPRISDKPELPYTEAVLCEIQRMGTIVPLAVPHMTAEDTTIEGYNIPKGTIVMSNIWHNHFDPLVWEEPGQFRPERFLDKDGKFRPREELIPFGIGRRICLGEHLAKMELFIFFTHLLHHFTLKKPDHVPAVSLEGKDGLVWSPASFEVCATARE
ncbi:cytochrome P450 2J6-like isoform X2 [Acanthaster planci]|nr:cytochrome P450 2J6-like isoform X2 [Acanthaster planci]XP_022106612.1 cytochrome P450 2J6-like isoform X2 [Acanthaster planci]XP_022106619.1 cytochrome P450 2J6-like isoform X2 [Acanthaster planci]